MLVSIRPFWPKEIIELIPVMGWRAFLVRRDP
jgi:hypothetical protein